MLRYVFYVVLVSTNLHYAVPRRFIFVLVLIDRLAAVRLIDTDKFVFVCNYNTRPYGFYSVTRRIY